MTEPQHSQMVLHTWERNLQVKDGADTLASSLADGADEVTSIHADEETTDMFSSPVEDNGSKLTNVKITDMEWLLI